MKQRITVLGSTGSIGVNTLDVVARHPERFEVFALSAASRVDLMFEQCRRFEPVYAVMAHAHAAAQLADRLQQASLKTRVLGSADALQRIASDERVHVVMAAIVALVVGAEVFLKAVREGGAQMLPIDSEHSAIFQSLPDDPATWPSRVEKIILTASGGPFLQRDPATFHEVTPAQACKHPNWVMGRKISVDSATMMNKALEVIEARYLFGVQPKQIEVVIHPQSIIHSMVQYRDTSVVAQLGTPDMRVPIAYGLSWPERIESGALALDFRALPTMTFLAPDDLRFPGLQLAWEVLAGPVGSTAVLNAANEVAVQAFLDGQIRFDQIHRVNRATLDGWPAPRVEGLDDLLAIDRQARERARTLAHQMGQR
ncbi:MAG: 1-deoxy-D-xylulose-5-phosphate reductoisomerase [Comamonadaceae bacterium]|nr:1-deoxy-D-xylulose-5-phosphate reductoisomerase [Comamonadaceae bacterium]